MKNFFKENFWWFMFTALFAVLFLIKLLIPDIESISWLNKIITFPFILIAGIVILVGGFKVSQYLFKFFECKYDFQAGTIVLIIASSLVITLQML